MTATAVPYNLTHPTLHQGLTTYMYMVGTSGYFPFSEPLEKQIRNMNLYINPEENKCYTDFVGVYLGLKFQYFKNNIDYDYVRAKGIVGHEVGHLRFTSKKAWTKFVNRVVGVYKKAAVLARDLLNITEDYRIEYLMGIVSEFLEEQFFLLCQEMAENIQKGFDELDFSEELPNSMKLNIIRNAVLYMRCTNFFPYIDNKELMDYVNEIYPYVLTVRKAKSTNDAVLVTEKIMEILKPLIDEHNQSDEGRMDQMYDSNSKGFDSPVEGDQLEQMKKQVKEFDERKKTAKEDKDGNKGKKGKKDEEKEESLIPKEVEKALDKIAEKAKKELEKSKGKGKNSDAKDESGNDADSKDADNERLKTLRDYVEDLASKIDKYKEKIQKNVESKKEQIEKDIEENSVTNEMIGNFLKSTSKTKEQELREFNEQKKIVELKPLYNPILHKDCKPFFKPKQKMTQFSLLEYMQISSQLSDIISTTAKELINLSERKWQTILRFQKAGRLDRRRLINAAALGDSNIFKKKQVHKEKLKMDFMILIDNSGSNGVKVLNKKNNENLYRFQLNQLSAIFLHETLKQAELQHTVWNFHEEGSYSEWFSPMIDFANCLQSDAGLLLKDIGARGGNRDGYSIAYAGDYLQKNGKSDKKLLIVVSDGQPAGFGGYGGEQALSDVKGTVEELEKRGIKTIGIFTGHEAENQYFEKMYRNHLFLNNDSIYDLPNQLKNIIVKEFEKYLMTF